MKSKVSAFVQATWMCCCLQLDVVAQPVYSSSDYRFQHYDMADGLASESAKEIVQDSLGFLWILHDNGLSRYDGYNFKVYKHDPGDTLGPGPPLDGFLELDKLGNLWVVSNQWILPGNPLILTRYDRRKDAFIKYFPDMKGALVRAVGFDNNRTTVWIGTWGRGLYSFDMLTGETKNYLNIHPDSVMNFTRGAPSEQRNAIFGISDRDSILLIATWRGLWKFDKKTKTFGHLQCHPDDSAMFYNDPVVAILEWPEYNNDLYFVIPGKGLIKVNQDVSEKSSVIFDGLHGPRDRSFLRDRHGIFWLADINSGLYRYDPNDATMVNLRTVSSDPFSLRSNRLTGFTVDRDQNMWVTTEDRGISKLPKQNLRFYNYDFEGEITGNTVFDKEGKNYLIVSQSKTSQEGDNEILFAPVAPSNLKTLGFKKVKVNEPIPGRVSQLAIGKDHLWIGTWGNLGNGVVGLSISSSPTIFEPEHVKLLTHDPENHNTISGNDFGGKAISGLWEDTNENLWVGTYGAGLNKVKLNVPYGHKGSVFRYNNIQNDSTSLSNNVIWWEFYPEGKNSFWVITASGLDLFRNDSFGHYFKNDYVATVKRDSKGIVLVGTTKGLYESAGNKDFIFRKIPSKVLEESGAYAIQEDQFGRLWISTHGSLKCYDRQHNSVATFSKPEGFNFARDKLDKTSDGIFITADWHGISLFDPSSFKINQFKVTPVLVRLTVNNKSAIIGSALVPRNDFIIKNDISVLDELILDYQHNNFAIEFSAMEMTAPEKNFYRHKLEGYDKDWIETDWRNRTATYTNLNAGSYVFKVRATNSHGIWSDHETTLSVRILPPPWKTWWAYTLYGLAFIAALLSWRHYENKRLKLKHHAEHLSELDSLKSQFFANISHEFRTPITLILGPLKELYEGTFTGDYKSALGVMIRNGQRLLRLINQLLDLSKLEAGKMQLHASSIDLVQFLKEIASSYESHAANKKIKFLFYPEVQQLLTYVDEEKIEKVIHNLLSNAFKFTREGGEIILYLKVQDRHAIIVIKDSGIGIPSDQVNRVFDRFYQVDNSLTRSYEGSGLGMALAKELIELHHGKISVESIEGRGTTFTVQLPLDNENLRNQEVVDPESLRSQDYHDAVSMEHTEVDGNNNAATVTEDHQSVVLIVEDNADMRNFIRKILSANYHIIEADNGKEGLKKAQETVPDLIISDIMMPEMDGYKLCEIIKTKDLTSHIPVILLTAKADHESKLTGLETGADDYLSKPFDTDELKLIVRNRIEERRKMRERFSREVTLEPKQISITSLDEKFLMKVLAIIEDHMDDETFSIEDFSQEAGYSKIQFYRKIRALSGQSPSRFLRTIRLKRAADLLSKNSDNVSQIAYSVGFGSLSYFNKCFKEQFGTTPGQFSESNKAKKLESP